MTPWRPGTVHVAMLLVASCLPAQLRKPCFVTVVDDAGKPVADAEVVMQWLPGRGTPGTADHVTARTDVRGRCRPALVVGRLYQAWAIGSPCSDGAALVSEPTDRGACGVVFELVVSHVAKPRRLQVELPAALAAEDRFTWQVGPDDPAPLVLQPDARGVCELPPSRQSRMWVCWSKHGTVWQALPVEPEDAAPCAAFAAPPLLHLRATKADGTPAAGATGELTFYGFSRFADCPFVPRASYAFRALAIAEANGVLTLPLAGHGDRGIRNQIVRIRTPGLASVCRTSDRFPPNGADAPAAMPLQPVTTIEGVLRGRRTGEQVAAQLLFATEDRQERSVHVTDTIEAVRFVGDRMSATVPPNVREHQFVCHLLPTVEGQSPRCLVLAKQPGPPDALPDVDLAKLRQLRLRVVAPDGAPASGAVVAIASAVQNGDTFRAAATHLACDLAGAAELLLGDGAWAIYASHGNAHAVAFVAEDRASGPLELPVASIPTLRCRVLDADGKPVAGARIEAPRFGGFAGALVGPEGWSKEAWAAIVAWPLVERARSDGDGVLQVPVQDWRDWTVEFRVIAGSRASESFPARPSHDVGDLVVK